MLAYSRPIRTKINDQTLPFYILNSVVNRNPFSKLEHCANGQNDLTNMRSFHALRAQNRVLGTGYEVYCSLTKGPYFRVWTRQAGLWWTAAKLRNQFGLCGA
jgi:hypothetical protein